MKTKNSMKEWILKRQEDDRLNALEEEAQRKRRETRRKRAIQESMDESNRLYDITNMEERNRVQYNEFKDSLKKTLICECIYHAFDQSIPEYVLEGLDAEKMDLYAMKHGFVEDLVNEQGVDNIIKFWRRTKSTVVEAYMQIVDDMYKAVIESCDKKDCSTFGTPTGTKDLFFSKVGEATPAEITDTIKTRVMKSIEGFLDDHKEMKNTVTDIYNSAQSKIASTDDDTLKEEYSIKFNRAIKEETYKRKTSVFGEMCMEVGKNIMYTDALREQYINEDGRLDIGSVIGVTGLMYTLLETCNTMKLIKVDKDYIQGVINGIAESTQQAKRKARSARYRSIQESTVVL